MSSTGSPEASSASLRKQRRASFAPSVLAQDRPSPKWLQRGGQGKALRRLSQRTVVSTMSPRQRRLWRLQQMAVKKQQAFQEALQSIPVSEMEKMVAAAAADLESATQCYERFVLANEGKGRYLWAKLRDLVATMDTETKLRIKLLPVTPMDRDVAAAAAAGAGGSASGGGSGAASSSSLPSSKTSTPRAASSSKVGTPRSVASGPRTVCGTPRSLASGQGGSRLGSPRSLLRAAASNAALPAQSSRIEINKRPQQTVFRWRTSLHVRLATDLPAELLRHRHDHEFDKYNESTILKGTTSVGAAAARAPAAAASSMAAARARHPLLAKSAVGLKGRGLGASTQGGENPAVEPAKTTPAVARAVGSRSSAAAARPAVPAAAAAAAPSAAAQQQAPQPPGVRRYGEQWAVPPRLWGACSANRLQDEDPVIQRIEEAAQRKSSVTAQEEELRERIASSEGALVYAKHLERKGARVPQYLQKAVRPPSRTAGRS